MSELYKKHQENKEVIDNTRKVRRAPPKCGETPVYQAETPRKSGQPFKRFARELETELDKRSDESDNIESSLLRDIKETYFHHVTPTSDTGIELNLLYNFYFISLDIYGARMQNKAVGNKLEAWLRFFSSDRPEDIIELIEAYPEFKPMYEDVYKLCVDTGRVMSMFSEELYELDRNTMKLMVDEMQDEIDDLQKKLADNIRKLADSYMKQDPSLTEDKAIEMARAILE